MGSMMLTLKCGPSGLPLPGVGLNPTTPVFVAYRRSRAVCHLYYRIEYEKGFGYFPACRPGMSVFGVDWDWAKKRGFHLCKRCRRMINKTGSSERFWL